MKHVTTFQRKDTEEYSARAAIIGMGYLPHVHAFIKKAEWAGDIQSIWGHSYYDADTLEPLSEEVVKERVNEWSERWQQIRAEERERMREKAREALGYKT